MEAKVEAGTARIDYWTPLLEQEAKNGYAALSKPQRLCYAVGQAEGEVFNGGFFLFFANSTAEQSRDAASGLEHLGASDCALLLETARAMLIGKNPFPEDAAARKSLIGSKAAMFAGPLHDLRLRFLEASEKCELLTRLENYAKANGLQPVIR